ncbi:hypothetical protein ACM66B_002290 [Microbotryomycetes sp. NB124-2]
MSIEFSFAAYLESLGSKSDDTISPSASTVSSSESSPTKRARSYSPDTSISSSSPPESYFAKLSNSGAATSSPDLTASSLTFTLGPHTTVSGISAPSPCPLRSILCSTLSMAAGPMSTSTASASSDASFLSSPATTSPPMSRPLSRRSSHSTKSVRFARCTNASVFPALSGEEYDRSPIIPTQESESLELPKRHKSEEEGWIKCVERERAAAAKKGLKPDLSNCGPCGAKPTLSTKSSFESPVEGVRGLIAGGYFVGEERERQPSPVVDSPDHTPRLGLALSRGDDVPDVDDNDDDVLDAVGGDDAMVVDDETGDDVLVQDDSSGDDSDASPAAAEAPTNETETRCREAAAAKQRYGLCALGKFTRRELFTSHDSLGGF